MNSKEILKKLTRYTIPAGNESLIYDTIQSLCNEKLTEDEYGNLFVKIGESDILFTAHLDTYSKNIEKVKHIEEDGFLKTDETTILGGDNKTGCAILLNMINNGVEGTYYFFIEEEIGRCGSIWYNGQIEEGEYKLAVAFDRREINRLVTHQRCLKMVNDELTNYLLKSFSSSEYEFYEDYFGFSCDTISFEEKVNNCINISNGTYDEHNKTEKVDLKFFDYIYNKVLEIDWKNVSKLSSIKVRGDLDFTDLIKKDKNDLILDTINFFLSKGYRPNKIPKFKKIFGLYTFDLYIKKTQPKIYDYFSISIIKDGKIRYRKNEMTKEDFFKYINYYKELINEKIIVEGNEYRISNVYYDKEEKEDIIIMLENGIKPIKFRYNNKRNRITYLKKYKFLFKYISDITNKYDISDGFLNNFKKVKKTIEVE